MIFSVEKINNQSNYIKSNDVIISIPIFLRGGLHILHPKIALLYVNTFTP